MFPSWLSHVYFLEGVKSIAKLVVGGDISGFYPRPATEPGKTRHRARQRRFSQIDYCRGLDPEGYTMTNALIF